MTVLKSIVHADDSLCFNDTIFECQNYSYTGDMEWTTQKLNWQLNVCQFGTHITDFKNLEQFLKIAVTGKSSLRRYISHGIPGGPDFGLMLVKYSNL